MAVGCKISFSVLLLNLLGFLPPYGQEYDSNISSSDPACQFALSSIPRVNLALNHLLLSTSKHVRHLVRAPRGKKYYGSRTCYYSNSDSSFQQSRLLSSGDVSTNPGPSFNTPKCSVCAKSIACNHRALSCDGCEKWCHIKCGNVNPREYKNLQRLITFDWTCPRCLQDTEASFLRSESVTNILVDNPNTSVDRQIDEFTIINNKLYDHPGLKIGHINVNGLKSKLSELHTLLTETSLDILAITETKLANDTSDEEISIEGYFTIRNDRNKNGGGVLLYYKDSLAAYEEHKLLIPSTIEGVWINVKSQSQTWLFACVYRPPTDLSFYNEFNDMLEKVWSTRKNVVIMGDLNSDLSLKSRDDAESHLGRRLLRILRSYGMKCVIKDPTRISDVAQTLIDLIIVSQPDKITAAGVSHLGISDHSFVYANLRMRKEKSPLTTKTINNYRTFNQQKFRNDIECAPWSVCETFDDIEDQVWAWQYLYQSIVSDHIPTRQVRTRKNKLPWITNEIKKEQNKRYRLLKIYKANKDPHTWSLYKATRNRVKKLIRDAELTYWREQFAKSENSKRFWQVVRKAQGKNARKPIPPVQNSDGTILTNDSDKAEEINKYFANIGIKLAEKFHHDSGPSINQPPAEINPESHFLDQVSLSEGQMKLKLSHIKQKTGGPDKITSRELAEAADSLFEGLFSIFKNSVQSGIFPQNWKTGEVVPVFKKGIKSDCANYRPLTMLNLTSKMLESVVCDSLDHHLGSNELIHPNQWGFKKGVSTESLLLYLTESWKKAIDDGYKVGVLFVDFKKAFDTVDHNILKTKLSDVGLTGVFHKWIVSYLHERSQFATVNGARSSLRQIAIGVPQGSLMGPRLFSIYVNDLPSSSETGCIHMFADDTTIYYIGKDVEEIVDALNLILNDFKLWCYKNHLTVHTGKTVAMLISLHAFVGPMRPLMFGDSYIYFHTKSTCLGVEIDNKLNWKPQVKALHVKFGGKLKFLKRFKGLPSSVLEEIYFKGVVPSITYCIAIWGSCAPATFEVLEHLHLKAAKLIHKLPSETPDSDVLDRVKWKPLGYIYKRRLASIMYQVFHSSLPDHLTALFETCNTTNTYNLRRTNDFPLVRYNCNLGRNSVRYRGPMVWNLLPKSIRDASSQELFKLKLRQASRILDQIQFEKEACQISTKQKNYIYF